VGAMKKQTAKAVKIAKTYAFSYNMDFMQTNIRVEPSVDFFLVSETCDRRYLSDPISALNLHKGGI